MGNTIQEFTRRIKGAFDSALQVWFVPALVILVGLASFALGRLSATEESRPAMSIRTAHTAEVAPMSLGGQVVASRSGNAYHFPWCPGAQSMKESNKIWFKDEAAARKAGYKPAGNCEGLE